MILTINATELSAGFFNCIYGYNGIGRENLLLRSDGSGFKFEGEWILKPNDGNGTYRGLLSKGWRVKKRRQPIKSGAIHFQAFRIRLGKDAKEASIYSARVAR